MQKTGMRSLHQINTPNISGARQPERARFRVSQRHTDRSQQVLSAIDNKTRVHDEAALNALRQSLAHLLMELVGESWKTGETPRHAMSKEWYSVYRIGIAGAEFLLEVRERGRGVHVKYVCFDDSVKEPISHEFYVSDASGTRAEERYRVSKGQSDGA